MRNFCDAKLSQVSTDQMRLRHSCAAALVLNAKVAFARGEDARPLLERARNVLDQDPESAPQYHDLWGDWTLNAARIAIASGEAPDAYLSQAIEHEQRHGHACADIVGTRQDHAEALSLALEWAMKQGKAKESMFAEFLPILVPITTDEYAVPGPFQMLANVHERHAAWLLENHKDPTDALAKGLNWSTKR